MKAPTANKGHSFQRKPEMLKWIEDLAKVMCRDKSRHMNVLPEMAFGRMVKKIWYLPYMTKIKNVQV